MQDKPVALYRTAMARKVNRTEAPIVLIVDDDVSMRWSTGRFVRSLGMRAEPFASAQHCYQRSGRPGSAFRVGGFLRKPGRTRC